eukprot:GEMP01021294.1.p1 GENE.GEMP01021294.1~~GEMP01021294.1.p1  ORF type:complete len:495 (+),score=88.80 GEMP01021294.1:47-1531(+)
MSPSPPRPRVKGGFTLFLNDVEMRLESTTRLLALMRHDFGDTPPPTPKPLLWRGGTTHSQRIERNSLVRVREGLLRDSHTSPSELTIIRSLEIEPDYDALHEERNWKHAMCRMSQNAVEYLHVSSRDLAECSGDVNMLRKRSRSAVGLCNNRGSSLARLSNAPSCLRSSFHGFRRPATPQGCSPPVLRPPSAPPKFHPFRLPIPVVTADPASGASSRAASRPSTSESSPRTPTSRAFPHTHTSHPPSSRPTSCPPTSKTCFRLFDDEAVLRATASRASSCAATAETPSRAPNSEASYRAPTAEASYRAPIPRPSKGPSRPTPKAVSRLATSETAFRPNSRASSRPHASKASVCNTFSLTSRPSLLSSSRPTSRAISRPLTAEASSRPATLAVSRGRSARHPAPYVPENHWEVAGQLPRGAHSRPVAKPGADATKKRHSQSVPRPMATYGLRPQHAPGRYFIPSSPHLVTMMLAQGRIPGSSRRLMGLQALAMPT